MENQESMTDISYDAMKKCADCGKEISITATSCPNCGAPQQATLRKCPDCGKNVSIHASRCPNCGRPLEPAVRTDIKPVNMGFSLLALPIIIVLCSWCSTKEFGAWTATSLFIFILAVFIGIEAYRNRKIKNIGNPLLWTIGTFFFYPIVYPYYMFKRKEIRLDSILKWVSIPLAMLTLYFWIASYNQPGVDFSMSMSDFSSELTGSTSSGASSSGGISFDEAICRKAKEGLTEQLADLKGSEAPSCTSVTIVRKVSKTKWIGKAVTSNGKSGEISIDITAIGDNDQNPFVMVAPVNITDFYNPLE